jgi:hypothetical protein
MFLLYTVVSKLACNFCSQSTASSLKSIVKSGKYWRRRLRPNFFCCNWKLWIFWEMSFDLGECWICGLFFFASVTMRVHYRFGTAKSIVTLRNGLTCPTHVFCRFSYVSRSRDRLLSGTLCSIRTIKLADETLHRGSLFCDSVECFYLFRLIN